MALLMRCLPAMELVSPSELAEPSPLSGCASSTTTSPRDAAGATPAAACRARSGSAPPRSRGSAFARGLPGHPDDHTEALLTLGLFTAGRLTTPVTDLSTGQRQRLSLPAHSTSARQARSEAYAPRGVTRPDS